jgi:hypothetical protein
VEQSVMRLRKPGGAAQPGEVIPVLVAVRNLTRRRARNPMEGSHVPTGSDSSVQARAGKSIGSHSEREAKGKRGRSGDFYGCHPTPRTEDRVGRARVIDPAPRPGRERSTNTALGARAKRLWSPRQHDERMRGGW